MVTLSPGGLLIWGSLNSVVRFYILLYSLLFKLMFSGKIYRNKALDLSREGCATEIGATRSPLRKVLSNGQLLQTSPSFYLDHNEEVEQDAERNRLGCAREYVEKSQRRMKERVSGLERMYKLGLQEMQQSLKQKDTVIEALREAMEEKDRVIQSLRRQNEQALMTSRSIIHESFSLQR